MKIIMPDGSNTTMDDIVVSLKDDGIVFNEINPDNIELVRKHHKSYIQQRIVSSRNTNVEYLDKYYNTRLSDLLAKEFISENMPEVMQSSKIILEHMSKNNNILLVSDFDSDGITSAAVGYKMFKKLFKYNNIEIIVNTRKNGNGINNTLRDILLSYEDIGLIITSDHGSSDGENLLKVKEGLNCDIIVTDHHLFAEDKAPYDIDVFVNPQRYDNDFKNISGTHVLYYTLLHAFYEYVGNNKKIPTKDETNYIYYLLTYVGLTTISDCMDLKNYINRKVVKKMLTDLNSKHTKHEPFWKHIIDDVVGSYIMDETSIGYKVSPLLNSPGRISNPRLSYELMISDDIEYTRELYEEAKIINSDRKKKQTTAVKSDTRIEYSDNVVCVTYIEDADGVQGIVANNIMYNDGYKIVIVFTKAMDEKHGEVFTGSGRSQDVGLDLKDVLDTINKKDDILLKYGGHKGAVGCKIKPDLKKFFNLLKEEISKREVTEIVNHYIDDYIYSMKKLILNMFDIIDIAPYGIGYAKPIFASDLFIHSYRIFKTNDYFITLDVKMRDTDTYSIKVFYNVKEADIEEFENNLINNKYIRLVYNMSINSYRKYNNIILNGIDMKFKK